MLQNSLLQSHCFFVTHRESHQLQQAFSQPDLFGGLLSLSEFTVLAKAMKATPVPHELANGFKETEVCGIGSRQLLPVTRGSGQMSLAFLLRTSRVSFIACRFRPGIESRFRSEL